MTTHNITAGSDKEKMERWQRWLEGKGIPCQLRPHPIFGWGVYTDQAHIDQAQLLKEQYGERINVLTGETVGKVTIKKS